MHRISSRQDALLEELHEMTRRVETLSQREHDLISEVHPQVNEIKEQVESVEEFKLRVAAIIRTEPEQIPTPRRSQRVKRATNRKAKRRTRR